MTGRGVVFMSLALVAAPVLALADHAVPRGGGSSSGSSSSSSGSSHHSDSGGSASSSSHSGSSSSSSSDSHSSSARGGGLTDAQSRHPRAGTGHGYGGYRGRGGYGGYGGYGSSYFYYGYPYSRGYGYYGPSWYGYDYGYSPYYSGGGYGYSPRSYRYRSNSGSLRLQVQPEKTRVYVDGYYAGIVDDFDGLLQRLYLPSGRHEVTLKLEGYRTHTFKLYVPVDQTLKVHHEMVHGEGAPTVDLIGSGSVDYAQLEQRDRDRDDRDQMADRDRMGAREQDADDDDDDEAEEGAVDREDAGSVRLNVQPADASVYVDGRLQGAARDVESLDLAPGHHHVEVVRPGFRTVERDVEVGRGRTADVNVELRRE